MSTVREIHSEALGDSCYEVKHPSGLTVMVYPKEGYSTTYAIFGTNYGSIDTVIKTAGQEPRTIPEGTAHYLEHKLFESEELDAFERFAKTGASANAYTSFDKTCFLFSCAGNFADNLRILLDFVQHPYFTEQTVQKEQGIIGQEIRMYQDEPGWEVFFNLMKCLYVKHPVKIDIAGTVESIFHITADLLYDCYNNFYSLNNMVLAVAGNTTVEEVVSVVDEVIKEKPAIPVERADYGEPAEVASHRKEESLAVSMPLFALGFKENWERPVRTLREKLVANILLDYIAGEMSPLYNRLLNEGLINTSFGYEYFTGYGYTATIFEGESKDPDAVADAIKQEIARIKRDGLDQQEFDRILKMSYGKAIMDYNDIDGLTNDMVAAHFEGWDMFEDIAIYQNLTLADAEEQLKREFDAETCAISIIRPKEGD